MRGLCKRQAANVLQVCGQDSIRQEEAWTPLFGWNYENKHMTKCCISILGYSTSTEED